MTDVDFLEHPLLGAGRLGMTSVPGRDRMLRGDPAEALERDVVALAELGVQHIVCLLPDDELHVLGAGELRERAAAHDIGFTQVPIHDGHAPRDTKAFNAAVSSALDLLQAGEIVLVHCRAGFGRTGTFAACCLVNQGLAPADAIAAVRALRRYAIESVAQERFVLGCQPGFATRRA